MLTSETDFLRLFYADDAEIHFRAILPKGVKGPAVKVRGTIRDLENPLSELRQKLESLNRTRGIYFVPNSGGDADKDITGINAYFAEDDKRSIAEQHQRLDSALLPTTARIVTAKSVHAYFKSTGDADVAGFEKIQEGLIAHFDGDKSIKNPSRLMRLPGFDHIAEDGTRTPVRCVQFNPERVYSIDEMLTAFPSSIQKKRGSTSRRNEREHFRTWDALRAELGRRMIAEKNAQQNAQGNWDCPGICHGGESLTGLFYSPADNQAHCNAGCDQQTILRAFNLPEAPENVHASDDFAEMNDRFYPVQEDGKLRILEIRKDDAMNEAHWIRYSKHDFLEVAQSVYQYPPIVETRDDGKMVVVQLAKKWIESNHVPGKRVFPGGTVFAPEIDSERVGESLNLWRGFQYKPDFQGSWDLLADLTLNILCRGDNESFQYVLNWMARAVQFPHVPAGTAIVFKGIKGIGKGTLGRTFIKLFGIHGMHVSSMEHITGRFNIHLMDCVAMFADEAYWAGNRSAEGAFKALITEPWKLYEAKGLTPRRGRNCIHIIMASNEDWVIPAGLDGERRYAVFETTEESRPSAFWKALNAQLDNGGYGALLFDLLYRDITNFQVHAVPKTEALAAQKLQTMDPGEQWIYSLLDSGNWNGLPSYENGVILAADLQTDFIRSLGHNRNYESVVERVGRTLRKFIPGLKRIRIQRPENRIDISALRPMAYVLPSVETARNKFKEVLGHDSFGE